MGGGGKGGTTTQSVQIPPEVLARYNAVNARAEEVAATPFEKYSTDPNAFVAPLNASQQAGLAGTSQYANAAQPYYDVASQYTAQGAQAANPTALNQSAINQYMSPYLENVVGSTMANLRQQQMQEQSQLMGGQAARGAFGGDRAGIAAANLARQQQLASGQTLAGLLNQGYGQALQTAQQQQGIGLAAQQANLQRFSQAGQQFGALGTAAQGAGLAGAQAQLAAGQVAQQTEQAGKSALYNQFLQEKGYPFQVTQFLGNLAMGTGALSGSTTTTQMASDRRLKHDIKHIGETNDGEPLYSFKYKGDDTTHFGPMAQDVEKRHPEDIGLAGGYKTVNYDAVADRAAAHEHKQHAYKGGVVHSEGGAVLPFRAREGFSLGGVNAGVAAGFDPDFINELLKSREGTYAKLYGQPGTPRGVDGTPGGAGVVPKPSLAVARPLQPATPPPRQPSTIASGMEAGMQAAKLYGVGKELKKDYGEWQRGREEAAAKKAAAAKETNSKTADGGDGGGGDGSVRTADTGKAFEPEQQVVAEAPTETFDTYTQWSARGGRIHKKGGGGFKTPGYDPESDASDIMDSVVDEGDKDYASQFHGMQPKGIPGGQGGGSSGVGSKIGSLAGSMIGSAFGPFGSMIGGTLGGVAGGMFSTGGVAGERKGYRLGSTVEDERTIDAVPVAQTLDAVPMEAPQETALGRVRVAQAADRGTASDATGVVPPTDDRFERAVRRTFQFEGGLNPSDTNGTPSLFGINKKAHPDVDFSTLTREKAKEIYRRQYWDAIGASRMDPNLAHVAYDTAVISGPGKARELIAASGGDPAKLLQLRKQFQDSLIERNPAKFGKYATAWDRRLQTLRGDIGAETSAETAAPDAPRATMSLTSRNKLETGETRGAAVPGTAGFGRGATDEFSAPFLAIANKVAPDLPGFLKTENFWVPALGALAAGLSSRAPTKIQGIGEALAGGVGAYSSLRGQQAQLAESAARTEKTYADIVKDNIFEVGGRGYFRYLKPEGGYGIMGMVDYFRMPPDQRRGIKFDPRVETVMPDLLRDYEQKYGLGAGTGTGAGAGAGAGTGAATTGTGAGAGAATTGTGAGAATATGAGATTSTGAGAATTDGAVTRPNTTITAGIIEPSAEVLQEVRQAHEAIVQGGRERAQQEPDFYTPQKVLADASINIRPVLTSLASGLSSSPTDQSILRSGRAQEILNPIAQYMNNLAGVVGLPELINPADLASADKVDKAVAQFQQRASSEAELKAYAAFRDLAQTLPTKLNSPRAQADLLSSIYLQNQIEIDKQAYFDRILKNADQFDPQTALRTGRSANAAFNREFNADFYLKEKKQLERMFGTTIGGMKDPRTGRDMTVMQVLTTDPGRLTREDRADVVKQFGGDPRILRYFGLTM